MLFLSLGMDYSLKDLHQNMCTLKQDCLINCPRLFVFIFLAQPFSHFSPSKFFSINVAMQDVSKTLNQAKHQTGNIHKHSIYMYCVSKRYTSLSCSIVIRGTMSLNCTFVYIFVCRRFNTVGHISYSKHSIFCNLISFSFSVDQEAIYSNKNGLFRVSLKKPD